MKNRQKQLVFCKVCRKRKFDVLQGVICGLTYAPADFEDTCASFLEDVAAQQKQNDLNAASDFLNRNREAS